MADGASASQQHGCAVAEQQANGNSRRVFGRRFRTELCKSYVATGTCKYHNRCMYAHGDALLRTEEQNLADGLVSESAIRAWARTHKPEGPIRPPRRRGFRCVATSPCPIRCADPTPYLHDGSSASTSLITTAQIQDLTHHAASPPPPPPPLLPFISPFVATPSSTAVPTPPYGAVGTPLVVVAPQPLDG